MNKPHSETSDVVEQVRAELQLLRVEIAGLHDRSFDGVDSLLSVAQSELERVMKEREQAG